MNNSLIQIKTCLIIPMQNKKSWLTLVYYSIVGLIEYNKYWIITTNKNMWLELTKGIKEDLNYVGVVRYMTNNIGNIREQKLGWSCKRGFGFYKLSHSRQATKLKSCAMKIDNNMSFDISITMYPQAFLQLYSVSPSDLSAVFHLAPNMYDSSMQ